MKAILILNEMPSCCNKCPLFDCGDDRICCNALNKDKEDDTTIIDKDCPLITEEQYVNRLYSVLYDMVVRGILQSKRLAKKVTVKNVGEIE